MVYEISQNDIAQAAYGGTEKTNSTGESKPKIANGYLLLYERNVKYKLRNPESETLEKIELEIPQIEDQFANSIKEKNKKYWKTKYIFGPEYSLFVINLTKIKNPPIKFIIRFFLTIQGRNRERGINFVNLYKAIHQFLEDSEISD